jgi:hypothetical protein
MKKPKRTMSTPTFEAFQYLFEKEPKDESEVAIDERADTIPDLDAFDTTRITHEQDLELETLNESMENLTPPKSTTSLRFIQHSTTSVLDSLLEEAKREEIPEKCTSTYLSSSQDGKLAQIDIDDDELSNTFKFEE